ncbi:unnamed protein product [Caenorhabditis nigoni]
MDWVKKHIFCCCCHDSKKTEVVSPIIMDKPIPFSNPPRPGFKLAPSPPEGKGPSILFADGLGPADLPVGFYVSDLTHDPNSV